MCNVFLTLVQEDSASVRLFDRGDLNTYKDELRFLLVVASCCRGARVSDSLDSKDLKRLQSSFSSLLSEVEQLIGTVKSESVASMFRPATQARVRDHLVALTRRYVAARWLRRVLISNSVTTDDMQHTQCDMLDISTRSLWMSDFINVL